MIVTIFLVSIGLIRVQLPGLVHRFIDQIFFFLVVVELQIGPISIVFVLLEIVAAVIEFVSIDMVELVVVFKRQLERRKKRWLCSELVIVGGVVLWKNKIWLLLLVV